MYQSTVSYLVAEAGFEPTTARSRRMVEMTTQHSRIVISPCFGLSDCAKKPHRGFFACLQVIRPCCSHNLEGCRPRVRTFAGKKETSTLWVLVLIWLRRQDLNLQPSGYEPDELPGCSTPRYEIGAGDRGRTGTGLLPRDFKSRASAYSATPAFRSQTMRFS